MSTELTLTEHLDGLRAALASFASSAERAGLDADVPTCPDWTVRRLLAHQGMVHRWATGALRGESVDADAVERRRTDRRRPGGVAARGRRGPGRGDRGRARGRAHGGVPQRRPAGPPLLGAAPVPRDDHARRGRTLGRARRLPPRRGHLDRPRAGPRRHRRAARRVPDPQPLAAAVRGAAAGRGPARRRRRRAGWSRSAAGPR